MEELSQVIKRFLISLLCCAFTSLPCQAKTPDFFDTLARLFAEKQHIHNFVNYTSGVMPLELVSDGHYLTILDQYYMDSATQASVVSIIKTLEDRKDKEIQSLLGSVKNSIHGDKESRKSAYDAIMLSHKKLQNLFKRKNVNNNEIQVEDNLYIAIEELSKEYQDMDTALFNEALKDYGL